MSLAPAAPAAAVCGFAAHLRANGFVAGVAEAACALQALSLCGQPPTMRAAAALMRPVFASERGEWEKFDALFESYWRDTGHRSILLSAAAAAPPAAAAEWWKNALSSQNNEAAAAPSAEAVESESDSPAAGGEARAGMRRAAASSSPANSRSAPPPAEDRRALLDAGRRLARLLSRRPSRRRRPCRNRGDGLHFRRTVRRSLNSGGEPFALFRRRRRQRMVRLAALLDVSGSMKTHTGFFMWVLKGMMRGAPVEAFIFHTQLARITPLLRNKRAMRLGERVALYMQGMGGGTRIAASFDEFQRHYARASLGGRSALLVISDGYDTESPEKLAAAARALRLRTPRFFWLSPAPGAKKNLAVLPRALQAARPHLTALSYARRLEHLTALENEWGRR